MRYRTVSLSLVISGLLIAGCSGQAPTRPAAPPSAAPSVPAAAAPLVVSWSCLAQSTAGTPGIFAAGVRDAACPPQSRLSVSAGADTAAPSAPVNLTASVNGSTVSFSWLSGSADSRSYVIEAGSSTGTSNLANFNIGSALQTFSTTDVPPGTYYVRVRAANGLSTSGPSNEVVVVVGGGGPCAGAPHAPASLTSSVSGSSLSLSWSAPASGCAPTGYVIEAGSTVGSSNLANFSTGSTGTTFSAPGVAAGTYYVRVRDENGFSAGGPSNDVTVVVGGTTLPPTPGPSPTPTPPPTPIRWVGVAPDGMIVQLDPNDQCPAEYDLQLDLTSSGTVVTGTATTKTRRVEAAGDCSSALGQVATWPVINGRVGTDTISFDLGNAGTHRFSGTFTARRMTGTFVTTQTVPYLTTQTGSFVVNRQ